VKYFLVIILFNVTFTVSMAKTHVTFIAPDSNKHDFWKLVANIGQSAANNLDIDLEIIYSESNRFSSKRIIEKIVNQKNKPEFLIFFPYIGNTQTLFSLLDAAKIPFITLEQKFSHEIQNKIGKPRERFKYWLGQINYDNESGGLILLNALIEFHFKKYPKRTMYITGIGGVFDGLSSSRQSALQNVNKLGFGNKVVLNQIVPMRWEPKNIESRFYLLKQRYPNTNTYWCAGDEMALQILKEHKRRSNAPINIGGFDWLPDALDKINKGEMTASVGGHFLMVAKALIKIIDYKNGLDTFLTPPLLNQYELITLQNVKIYQSFINQRLWDNVNWSRFLKSKYKHHPLDLTVTNLISQQSSK